MISIAIGLWIIQNVTGSGSDLERATVAPTEKPTAASSDNAQIVRLQSQVATLQSALAEKTHDLDVERQSKPSKSRLLQLDNAMKWRFVKALQDTARKKNGDIEACLAVVNIQRNSQYATALWEELQPIIYYAGWHNMQVNTNGSNVCQWRYYFSGNR